MGRPSRFDSEFREHAVELVRLSRKPRARIAADLGISDTTLSNWMIKDTDKRDIDDSLSVTERAQFEALKAEKREWILEREILKKATAFWVKESNA
jgi:transposase